MKNKIDRIAEGEIFEDKEIILDNVKFLGCTFTRCTLVLNGAFPALIDSDCTIDDACVLASDREEVRTAFSIGAAFLFCTHKTLRSIKIVERAAAPKRTEKMAYDQFPHDRSGQ